MSVGLDCAACGLCTSAEDKVTPKVFEEVEGRDREWVSKYLRRAAITVLSEECPRLSADPEMTASIREQHGDDIAERVVEFKSGVVMAGIVQKAEVIDVPRVPRRAGS